MAVNLEKALDYLQSIISRMASNSASLKGWSVSVTTGVIGVAIKEGPARLACLAFLPIVIFWILDGYYLAAERAYRAEFNRIAGGGAADAIPNKLVDVWKWLSGVSTPLTSGVHGVLAIVTLLVAFGLIGALGQRKGNDLSSEPCPHHVGDADEWARKLCRRHIVVSHAVTSALKPDAEATAEREPPKRQKLRRHHEMSAVGSRIDSARNRG